MKLHHSGAERPARHGPIARWFRATGAAVTLLALAAAAATARTGSEECLACHGDREIQRIQSGRPGSVFVDRAAIGRSVHAGLECRACHVAAGEFPHPEKMPAVRCASCHEEAAAVVDKSAHGHSGGGRRPGCVGCHGKHDIQAGGKITLATCASCHAGVTREYTASVHGVALARGDGDASTCTDCHGASHTITSHLQPGSPVAHDQVEKTCARCHADRALVTRRRITIPEATALYEKSVHGRSNDPRAATCNSCHESHNLKRAMDPSSSVYRTNIPATCGKCHAEETRAYTEGVHGQALLRGVTATPVCTDCHGEHLIRGPHDPQSPLQAAQVTTTCSKCHEAEGVRETFSLPAGRRSTYEDSFHGLASKGGSPAVANCASCHGYHDILHSSDPRSAVSEKRLGETCGKCHPGAGTMFKLGRVHEPMAEASNPVLWWTRWVYLALIFGTIGGMVFHNALDFGKKTRAHLARSRGVEAPDGHGQGTSGRTFERMNPFERAQHLLLMTSFFALVYTGFALKFPDTWLFSWMTRLEQGYALRSLLHRIAAVVMVLASLLHVAHLFTPRGRQLLWDLLPRRQDATQAVHNLLYLLGARKAPPKFERFGYYEKAEYWALIWGTVVMTVTGLLLWFENWSLRALPTWALDLATLIHYYEAWLAFLAIVVWHIYMVVFNPDVYPMNWTWLTGQISEEQMRHEHRAQWERMIAEERAAEAERAEREAHDPVNAPAAPQPGGGEPSPAHGASPPPA